LKGTKGAVLVHNSEEYSHVGAGATQSIDASTLRAIKGWLQSGGPNLTPHAYRQATPAPCFARRSIGVGGPSSAAATHIFARASDRYALSASSVPSNRRNLRARDCWAVKSALSVCGAHLVFAASPHYSKSIGILPTSPRKPEKQVGSKRPKKGQHPYRTRNVTDSAETPHQHTAKTNSQPCEAGPPGLSDSKYACFVAQELCYLAMLARSPRLTPYSALCVFH
jgi:hypothetical protein